MITNLPNGVEFDLLTSTLTVSPDSSPYFELEVESSVDDGTGKILKKTSIIKVGKFK
jgi:hypothetical protein